MQPTTEAEPAVDTKWQEYVPDPNKSEEENGAAKVEHDKTKPVAEPETVAAELKLEDVKLPEGMEVSAEQFTELSAALAQEDPKARAQGLMDLYAKVAKEASEKGSQAWADTQKQWQEEVRADPDFGGAKLDESLGSISKLIDEYGDAEVRQVFDLTGAGNARPVFRMLAKIAATLAEGKPAPGGTPSSTLSAAEKMYPTMRK